MSLNITDEPNFKKQTQQNKCKISSIKAALALFACILMDVLMIGTTCKMTHQLLILISYQVQLSEKQKLLKISQKYWLIFGGIRGKNWLNLVLEIRLSRHNIRQKIWFIRTFCATCDAKRTSGSREISITNLIDFGEIFKCVIVISTITPNLEKCQLSMGDKYYPANN